MSNTILNAFFGLGKNINKRKGTDSTETEQGIVSEKFPELKLTTDNESLIKITKKWLKVWTESTVYSEWQSKSGENEKYWLGKHFDTPNVDKNRPVVDNAIFEGLETYLPQVTRRNPEPQVDLNPGEEENQASREFASQLKKDLGKIASKIVLRLKLKKEARHWAIYLVGAQKYSWDLDLDLPTLKIVRANKLILDPESTVDEDGYSGEFIGEHRKMQASKILDILKNAGGEEEGTKAINELVGTETGTEVGFIEWWTDEYMCWTMNDKVLLKKKNMHWNYDQEQPAQVPEPQIDQATGEPMAPEIDSATGQPVAPAPQEPTVTPGINHLKVPTMPYDLLCVFNLGKQPVDDTSLIGQNLSGQDLINKRIKQIDKNADSMNGGMVVSLERSGLTIQQSKGVTESLRKGGTIAIPSGSVGDAIARMSAPPLPGDIYTQLVDTRNRVKDIFGTRGSSAAGVSSETTVRGKIMNRTLDADRIGGGFSEYLEQMADKAYNYFVQLLYVYDEKYANGQTKPEVNISIKEGSLLPKDSTTIANQSLELAAAGKMSTIDLYKNLDYANPEELAVNVWLEANAPDVLYANDPRVQEVLQRQQAAASSATEVKAPSGSINFKDLPPDGQAQMAKKVGIDLHPEALAAHAEVVAERSKSTPPTMDIKSNNQ